jgi:hypothetical protein
MYDSGKIIAGLVIFVLFVTIPVWYNRGSAGAVPKLELPKDAKTCVLPAAEVLRDGKRETLTVEGKQYPKSLMLNCMKCHTSKKQFCDKCHTYTSVHPYCWDCHLAPVE